MSNDIKLAYVNNWATASPVTGTTAATGFPAANAQTPQLPFLTWRTTVTTTSDIRADLGSAKLTEIIILFNCNFTSVQIQANATDSWGAPTHNSGTLTVLQNAWNDRYTIAYVPVTPFTLRWNRILIPTQTPVGSVSYFELGGVWSGFLGVVPRDWRWGFDIEREEPEVSVVAESGLWQNRIVSGDLFNRIYATRQASLSPTTPMTGDELATWGPVDQVLWTYRYNAIYLNKGNTSHAWIMRKTRLTRWTVDAGVAESSLDLEEVIAG